MDFLKPKRMSFARDKFKLDFWDKEFFIETTKNFEEKNDDERIIKAW